MRIEFIVQERTQLGVMKKELESVDHLGRPPSHVSKEKKRQALEDDRIRNAIEGKFGQGKRRFGLNRVMTKLDNTSQTAIAITFLVMNLSTWWRRVFCMFLCLFGKRTPICG